MDEKKRIQGHLKEYSQIDNCKFQEITNMQTLSMGLYITVHCNDEYTRKEIPTWSK